MTAIRLIPFPMHGALELVTGLFLLVAPFLFAFSVPAAVISISVAVLIIGLAFGAATADGRGRSLPVATHHAFDYGLALGLCGAAAVLAIAGDGVAAIVLLAAAGAQFALNLTTRYSLRG